MKKIKSLRLQMGYSQTEFAKKLGISQSGVWQAENGRFCLSLKTAKALQKLVYDETGNSAALDDLMLE